MLSRFTTLNFQEESYLDPLKAREILASGLSQISELRHGLAFPLTYDLTFQDIPPEDTARIALASRAFTDRTHGDLTRSMRDSSFSIEVSKKALRIAANQNLASMTAHLEDYDGTDIEPGALAADVIAACAIFLLRFGAPSDAASLFELAGANSSFLRSYEAAILAASCLESERRFAEAYQIAWPLFLDPDPMIRNAGSIYMSVAILNLPAREAPLGDDLLDQYGSSNLSGV